MAGVFIKHGTRGETNLETDADAFFFFFFSPLPTHSSSCFQSAPRDWVVSLTVGSGNNAEPGGSVNAGREACAPRHGQMSTQRFHFPRRRPGVTPVVAATVASNERSYLFTLRVRPGVNYGLTWCKTKTQL